MCISVLFHRTVIRALFLSLWLGLLFFFLLNVVSTTFFYRDFFSVDLRDVYNRISAYHAICRCCIVRVCVLIFHTQSSQRFTRTRAHKSYRRRRLQLMRFCHTFSLSRMYTSVLPRCRHTTTTHADGIKRRPATCNDLITHSATTAVVLRYYYYYY